MPPRAIVPPASPSADSHMTGSDDEDGASPNSAGPSSVAGSGTGGGGGPGSKSKRPRPYASKTCSECRRRKIACVPSDQDPDKCKRCFKMQLHCTLPDEEERGDRRKKGGRRDGGAVKRERDGGADMSADSSRDATAGPSSSTLSAASGKVTKKIKGNTGKQDPSPPSLPHPDREKTEDQPDTDFLYSLKDDKARLRPGLATRPGAAQQRRIVGAPRKLADANRRIAVQFSMQVHGCPIWIYSDLMARFDLLSELSLPPPPAGNGRMNGCDLSARLTDLSPQTVKHIDDVLEDTRLMMPHIPLLQTVLAQQAGRYNSGRLLLIALLVYIATSGADPAHSLVTGQLKGQIIDDVRAWIQHQALNCVLFSPVKSRELVIAIELLAVYDPLLSQGSLEHLETPSFILPTSFYLDAAIGRASRSHIEASIRSLQDWYVQETSSGAGSSANTPLPERIVEALMDASMWVSLEVTSGEVNRNIKGMTNCFAKDYVSMWPGVTHPADSSSNAAPAFSSILTHCLARLPASTISLGARLGLVNLALRHSGLMLVQQVLRDLYDGIPDVTKMDRLYLFLQESLTKKCDEFSKICQERVVAKTSSAGGGGSEEEGSSASALLKGALIDLANDTLEREATWMRHFYGGYCFAILLWLPQLRKAPTPASRKKKAGGLAGTIAHSGGGGAQSQQGSSGSAANPSIAGVASAAASSAAASGAAAGPSSTAADEDGSSTPGEAAAPRFHEHGVHDSDLAKSVIDAIRDRNTNPDTIMADAASGNASSPKSATGRGAATATPSAAPAAPSARAPGMSPFDFLVKHTAEHEGGVTRLLSLSLLTNSRSRSSDVRRAVTNSRLLYACKEILENHATRRRGWGKVGEEAMGHVRLLGRVCDAYKAKGNVLDTSLAKLVRVLERVLDGWRRAPLQQQGPPAQAPPGVNRAKAERDEQQQRQQQPDGAAHGHGGAAPRGSAGGQHPPNLMPSPGAMQRHLAYAASPLPPPQQQQHQPQRGPPYYGGAPNAPSMHAHYQGPQRNEQYGPAGSSGYYGQQQHQPGPMASTYQQQGGGSMGQRGSLASHAAYNEPGSYGQQQQQQQGYPGQVGYSGNGNGYGGAGPQSYAQYSPYHGQQQQGQGNPITPSSAGFAPLSLLDLDLLGNDRQHEQNYDGGSGNGSLSAGGNGSSTLAGGSGSGGGAEGSGDSSFGASLVDFDVDNLWQSFGGPSTTLSVGMMMEDFMGGAASGGGGGALPAGFAQMAGHQGQQGAGTGGYEGFPPGGAGGGGDEFSQFMAAAAGGGDSGALSSGGATQQQQQPQHTHQQQGQQNHQQQQFAGMQGGMGGGGGSQAAMGGMPPLSAGLGEFDWATMSELFQP